VQLAVLHVERDEHRGVLLPGSVELGCLLWREQEIAQAVGDGFHLPIIEVWALHS
jgi:hypothetical protein